MGAIAATDKKKYQYVDYGDTDGVVLGQSATKKVGVYGYTPVSQAASIASIAVTGNTSDNINTALAFVNTLITDLSALGIIASS